MTMFAAEVLVAPAIRTLFITHVFGGVIITACRKSQKKARRNAGWQGQMWLPMDRHPVSINIIMPVKRL